VNVTVLLPDETIIVLGDVLAGMLDKSTRHLPAPSATADLF
jgi:hypothetical protein